MKYRTLTLVALCVVCLAASVVPVRAQQDPAKRFRAIAGGGFLGVPVQTVNKTPACKVGSSAAGTCTLDPTLSTFTAVSSHSLTPVAIQGLVYNVRADGLIAVGGGFIQAAKKDQDSTLLAPAAVVCVGPGTLQACFGAVLMGTSGTIFPNGGRQMVLPSDTDPRQFIVDNGGNVIPRAFFASFTIGQGF